MVAKLVQAERNAKFQRVNVMEKVHFSILKTVQHISLFIPPIFTKLQIMPITIAKKQKQRHSLLEKYTQINLKVQTILKQTFAHSMGMRIFAT